MCTLFGYLRKDNRFQWRHPKEMCFARRKRQNMALYSSSIYASTQKCTDLDLSLLFILKLGTYGKFARKNNVQSSAFASRRHAQALAACSTRLDHAYITTDESFRFHDNKFDEIPCKTDSTENPRSVEKYPTPTETFNPRLFDGNIVST